MNRVLTGAGLVGLALFIFGQHLALAFVGAALWGLGISLGFPVGMSAGADEPPMAAARVSVIASIGYCAFLAGPPADRLHRRTDHRPQSHDHGRSRSCPGPRNHRKSAATNVESDAFDD